MRLSVAKNLGWKLGSLIVAILLWVAMSSEPEVVTTHVAPVIYQNLPSGFMIGGTPPDTVRLELSGPASELTPAALDPMNVKFDLTSAAVPAERTLTVSNNDILLPRGVSFLRAVPSQVQVRLARLATKEVPVTVQFQGELPAGYRLGASSAIPEKLQIAGSDARVAAILDVKTEKIDLSMAQKTPEFRVNAFVEDPQVHFTASPSVTVKVAIEPLRN